MLENGKCIQGDCLFYIIMEKGPLFFFKYDIMLQTLLFASFYKLCVQQMIKTN